MTTKASPAVVDIPMAGFQNRIINGRMEVAQRGTAFLGIGSNDYSLDRWRHNQSGLVTMEHTQYEDAPADTGLRYCLRVYTSIPDPTVNANDNVRIIQCVEGHNIVDLLDGPVTISFWVKSSETGTYCFAIRNATVSHSYVVEYTIDAADTWERKIITVDFSAAPGTWEVGSLIGMNLCWTLWHEGKSATPDTWLTGNENATANQINHTAVTDSDWRLTGVELVKGEVPLEVPEVRPYAVEEMLCQRYYQVPHLLYATAVSATTMVAYFKPLVPFRDNPAHVLLDSTPYMEHRPWVTQISQSITDTGIHLGKDSLDLKLVIGASALSTDVPVAVYDAVGFDADY